MNYSSNKYNEVSKEIIDVDEIINNVWVKLSTIDGITSVHKIIEVDQNVPWICDKSRISMIIENITSNAIKYRNRSRKDACIFTQVKVTPHKVLLTIEDNGIGISEKYQEDIFNMFFRGTELSQGPGLGLYLVKETLDKLKGKIKVHSKPNVGTRFKLWIPNFYN
jgi:signal transduction histidine kinase